MPAVNDLPNPYRTVAGWAKLPAGRTWGSTSAVAIDKDGQSVWVAERCGVNNCAGSSLPSVLKFDATGTLVASFGAGLILSPHGIHVDKDGNVWVVDCACTLGAAATAPENAAKGHQIYKFSPKGDLLMTLGAPGGGRDSAFFWQPNAVITAPNGDIFVADGHSPNTDNRIIKYNSEGEYLLQWGTVGLEAGEFRVPHALAMDSQGRLFVADRGNSRIQIFDQEGNHLTTWTQFGRPSDVYIDANDMLYSADSESNTGDDRNPGWERGIRVGSVRNGFVTAFTPDPVTDPDGTTSHAEGVTVDEEGNLYAAEVAETAIRKFTRGRP